MEANEPDNWPARCLSYRAEIANGEPATSPQRIQPLAANPAILKLQIATWNGIRIPIPDVQFEKMVVIPESRLAAVQAKDVSVLFSRLDLSPHFEDHFGEIDEFSGYVESGKNLVDWLEDGWALSADDIQCLPEFMKDDLIKIVHSLVAALLVSVDNETRLMRITGKKPALVLGTIRNSDKPIRIQYIFQHPSSKGIELLHITYHLDHPAELVLIMSAFVSAIDSGDRQVDGAIGSIVEAILARDDDRAASLAESIGLTVKLGL